MRIWILIFLCSAALCLHLIQESHEENLIQGGQIDGLRDAELSRHNILRKKHGCPPLELNDSLNTIAQNYSQFLASRSLFQHSQPASSGEYGENLYKTWGSPTVSYSPGEASDSWYAQIQKYDFGTFPPADGTGHFTAMIWKSVTSVGFGYYKVVDNGQSVYVVANYYPTPNMFYEEAYKQNVPPPQSSSEESTTNSTTTLPQSTVLSNSTQNQTQSNNTQYGTSDTNITSNLNQTGDQTNNYTNNQENYIDNSNDANGTASANESDSNQTIISQGQSNETSEESLLTSSINNSSGDGQSEKDVPQIQNGTIDSD